MLTVVPTEYNRCDHELGNISKEIHFQKLKGNSFFHTFIHLTSSGKNSSAFGLLVHIHCHEYKWVWPRGALVDLLYRLPFLDRINLWRMHKFRKDWSRSNVFVIGSVKLALNLYHRNRTIYYTMCYLLTKNCNDTKRIKKIKLQIPGLVRLGIV